MTASPTKAIIIAAGRGRRLAPYTDEMPKCMVPVGSDGGTPIARVQLDALRTHGVNKIVFIRGYLGGVLEARAAELGGPVRFVENPDWADNNILESLFCAEDELSCDVVLSYSDIIYTPDVVAKLMTAPGEICLVVDREFRKIYEGRTEHPLEEAEVCTVDSGGCISTVGKKSSPAGNAYGEFIGLAKLSATAATQFVALWRELCRDSVGRENEPFQRAASFRQAYLTDLLQELIDRGHRLHPVDIAGQWREIDTVQDLRRARALLSSSKELWK